MSKGTEPFSTESTLYDKARKVLTRTGVALAGFALAACGGGETTKAVDPAPANTSETPSATPTPMVESVTESTPETETGPVTFGISAAEYLNDPNERAQEFVRQYNALQTTGIDKEVATSEDIRDVGVEAYLEQISDQPVNEFFSELLVDDWASSPNLVEAVASMTGVTYRTRELRLLSLGNNMGDLAPYYREMVIDEAQPAEDPMVTNFSYYEKDNASETGVADNIDGIDVNKLTGGLSITWVEVDGKLKISNIATFVS